MKVWHVVVVWCVCGGAVTGGVKEVAIGASECQMKNTELHCDYTDVEQTVSVSNVGVNDPTITRVVLSNARHLEVSVAVCINLTLQAVTQAQVAVEEGHECRERQSCVGDQCEGNNYDSLEFSANNTGLDHIPGWATKIHLDHCRATSLALKNHIQSLYVANSDIKVLDLANPLDEGSSAKLVSTNIHTLQRLHTGPGSRLELRQSTIDVLASQGLVFNGGHVELVASAVVTVMDKGLALGSRATFHIRGFSGHIQIHVLDSNNEGGCKNSDDIYFWLFIVLVPLMTIILAALILVECVRKRRRSRYLGQSHSYVFHKPT
ncbi:hypothetical protein Pmani_008399 [Petrolisthes manimaculis]|uniref:Uncharacterized protein n=1 Tax=Petrolisthes manimaculis TaxID=1843537 RepID=A0AAE1Q8Y7_9EUCA|nr:hypothetical protein Pmani_008399 [Petrolisthes manimaculis]